MDAESGGVKLRAALVGRRATDGARVLVPAGTRGTVVHLDPYSPWLGVAVRSESGRAELRLWAHRDDLEFDLERWDRIALARLRPAG